MRRHLLRDVRVRKISLVPEGANGKRFYLRKSAGDPEPVAVQPRARLVKSQDWSTVYCVVAEPGALEGPGIWAEDQDIPDQWMSEDEIRKACHRFSTEGGVINLGHLDGTDGSGATVENFIAPEDFTVLGPDGSEQQIRKGSWCVGIQPGPEGRQLIEQGQVAGVSLEGDGIRELVLKTQEPVTFALDEDLADACRELLAKAEVAGDGRANVSAGDKAKLKGLAKHYLAQAHPFTACKRDQIKHGLSEDHAKKRCAVLLDSFDPKRKRHSVRKSHPGSGGRLEDVTPPWHRRAFARIGKAAGMSDEQLAELMPGQDEELEPVAKAMPTFAELMAQRELDEELPQAFSVLRDSIWRAFTPLPTELEGEREPRDVIEESLQQFGEWALDLLDRLPLAKAQEAIFTEADRIELAKAADPNDQTSTMEDEMSLTDDDKTEIRAEIAKAIEEKVPTAEAIAKAVAEASKEPEPPTAEELREQIGKVAGDVEKIAKGVEALGQGGSTQPEPQSPGGPEPIAKATGEDAPKGWAR
jgi:hypothetical protein